MRALICGFRNQRLPFILSLTNFGANLMLFSSLPSCIPVFNSPFVSSLSAVISGCVLEPFKFPLFNFLSLKKNSNNRQDLGRCLLLTSMFSRVDKSKFKWACRTMYPFVRSPLVVRIVTNLSGYHVVSLVIFWLLRLLRIFYSLSDLRSHVTDSRPQFLQSVSSY